MKQDVGNSGDGLNRFMSCLAAEKKKGIMALCLIAVMAFMWVRALGGKAPKSAEAAMILQETTKSQSNSESKIYFVELPKVKGRNDVLTRDFFTIETGRLDDRKGVNVVSENNSEEYVKRITKKLKLGTISLGKNPQAFINNKLLSVGDKLPIADGVNTYECEIIGIEKNKVFIRCGEAKIQLILVQPSVVDY